MCGVERQPKEDAYDLLQSNTARGDSHVPETQKVPCFANPRHP